MPRKYPTHPIVRMTAAVESMFSRIFNGIAEGENLKETAYSVLFPPLCTQSQAAENALRVPFITSFLSASQCFAEVGSFN